MSDSCLSPSSNTNPLPLTRIVSWAQQLACEVLRPGDCAVDLTAGKGRDTLVLAKAVGASGQVVAFDLQSEALTQAQAFLQQHDFSAIRLSETDKLPAAPGLYLVKSCHSLLQQLVTTPCRAIMANLGYFPGGDHSKITRPETTLAALRQALKLLLPGGRLAVTVYPAHAGGAAESDAVSSFFAGLSEEDWRVLKIAVENSVQAPYVLVVEKR